ncbi:MAG: phosphate transport system substrate-binding protein [Lysobacterales bacterium]|jgi:phosphate transport system substrate-binding protein
MKLRFIFLLGFFLLPPAWAQTGTGAYEPAGQLEGSITIWGHGAYGKRIAFVEGLVDRWEAGFHIHHPRVSFNNRLHGTASAIGALYTGTGDLALMGREIWPPEIAAFSEVRGYAPTGVEVMTGSFDVRNKGYALVVFTHKDNPIKGLSLTQLDAIYGVERRRGHKKVATWGDLGLDGEWGNAPVNLYGFPIARGFAVYFQDRVMLNSHLWNPSLREFPDDPNSVSTKTDGATRMLAALANDKHGIAYAGLVYNHPLVKALPLTETAEDHFVMPSEKTVADRSYPLTRIINMFVDKHPDEKLKPQLEAFLRFILSSEGQQIVARDGHGYLPLPADLANKELEKLSD